MQSIDNDEWMDLIDWSMCCQPSHSSMHLSFCRKCIWELRIGGNWDFWGLCIMHVYRSIRGSYMDAYSLLARPSIVIELSCVWHDASSTPLFRFLAFIVIQGSGIEELWREGGWWWVYAKSELEIKLESAWDGTNGKVDHDIHLISCMRASLFSMTLIDGTDRKRGCDTLARSTTRWTSISDSINEKCK